MATVLPVVVVLICVISCGVDTKIENREAPWLLHHPKHMTLTRTPTTEISRVKSQISDGTFGYQHNMSHPKDVSQYMKNRRQKTNTNSAVVEGFLHQETSTSRMVRSYQGAIHSVVVEGKFGVDLTRKINKTFEYLFEFTYNATELQVSKIILTER